MRSRTIIKYGIRNTILLAAFMLLFLLSACGGGGGGGSGPSTLGSNSTPISSINLPKTGQTQCYDPSGASITVITCPGTGQDGAIQAGVTWPNPRFSDNLDGTVSDNLT